MSAKESYVNYHFPRWSELPDIELYMDQVVGILERNLSVFTKDEKKITPAMINNYVKQKIVKPPVKKRYDRTHIALLFVVCIMKQIMPISQICKGIELALGAYSVPELYDVFCTELENSLHALFSGAKHKPSITDKISPETLIVKTVTASYANLVYANYLIDNTKEQDN